MLDDGGRMLADECVGTVFRLRFEDGPHGRPHWKRFHTTHCNQAARFDVYYDKFAPVDLSDDDGVRLAYDHPERPIKLPTQPDPSVGHARVCAVDDAVGLWPRYKDVVSTRSYLR